MQDYDATLKLLLKSPGGSVLRQITGLSIERWLNVEMQQVQASRVDLLGETAEKTIVHIELQATNDADMPLRMAEYSLNIYRQFRRFPQQTVLYFGQRKLRMADALTSPDHNFKYTLLDFRELEAEELIASEHIEDTMLAILARLQDQTAAVRRILQRLASLDESGRRDAFVQFLIISGMRRLGPLIKEEAQRMPILNSLLDHDLIGPAILQGRQEGRQEGHLEVIGELLVDQLGPMPDWVDSRLSKLSMPDIKSMFRRARKASSYEELFPTP